MECLQAAWNTQTQTPIQKLVLARLSDRANGPSNSCWPGIDSIAKDCCLSESSVHRAIKGLLSLGLIRVQLGGGQKSNTYFCTPVTRTPVSNRHPCQSDTPPLSIRQGRGVPQTPKPELNPKGTQRGAPRKFVSEIEGQIKRTEARIEKIKMRFPLTNTDRAELKTLVARRNQLETESIHAA